MKYDRFTERVGNGIAIKETSTNDNRSIWNAIEHLAELEDKIEQGTLIELPELTHKFAVVEYSWQKKKPLKVLEYYPCSYDFSSKGIVNCWLGENMNFSVIEKDFSTREEAEKKLQELKE